MVDVIASSEPVLAVSCFASGKVGFLAPIIGLGTKVSPPLLEKGFQGGEIGDVGVDVTCDGGGDGREQLEFGDGGHDECIGSVGCGGAGVPVGPAVNVDDVKEIAATGGA